jgi:CRP-like cAMP-binding protein
MINIDTLLAWGATFRKIAPNEIIFREGTECHFYYQLVSGSVRWININDAGCEFIQYMIEPGESFGEIPLFDDSLYAATAVGNSVSVIVRLHKSNFRQVIKEQSEIHFKFTRLLAERLRFKFLLLKELSCFGPEHRISSLFNYFKESRKNLCINCTQIRLTRQQIANMTGLRVETVIRAIRGLHEKGILTIDKGKVYC